MRKFLLIILIFHRLFAFSQTDSIDLFSLSLEELLDVKISVATKKATIIRESPGIVTLITKEEIRNSGARDLIDVLQLVPGIHFGTDVQGVVGIGTRGIWAHEGKALLLINGIEYNDLLYGTNQFGNHFSVDMIKRIEIIRGPCSAMYGGNAELMVINIITLDTEELNGALLSATYGNMSKGFGRTNVGLSLAKNIKDVKFDLHGFYGNAIRSDRNYKDILGNEFNFRNGSNIQTQFVNFNMDYKGLLLRFIYDTYNLESRQWFGDQSVPLSLPAIPVLFNTIASQVYYEIPISSKLKITPKFDYLYQKPWSTPSSEMDKYLDTTETNYYPDAVFATDISDYKYCGSITLNYDVNEKVDINAGVEYKDYGAKALNDNSLLFDKNGQQTLNAVKYQNFAGFAQSTINSSWFNLTFGGRFEHHNIVGNSVVPRIGLTKVINKFHFKALFSQSFRSPSIQNICLNYNIKPEKSNVSEIEMGYALTKKIFITGNLFYIDLKDPIIYYVDSLGDAYKNYSKTGTLGGECELSLKLKSGYSKFSYSYYNSNGLNSVDLYAVPNKTNILLGFPTHKITLNNSYKIYKLNFSPSLIFLSERHGVNAYDANGDVTIKQYPAVILANLFIGYNNLLTKGLDLSIGCYDLLNSDYQYIQPYLGATTPIPAPSRELLVKIRYNFSKK